MKVIFFNNIFTMLFYVNYNCNCGTFVEYVSVWSNSICCIIRLVHFSKTRITDKWW